jgi:general secretion pathway protein K
MGPKLVNASLVSKSRESGVALISVLLIVAILVALCTQLLSSHNLVVSQHQNSFERNQALEYGFAAEELARQLLFDDFINSGVGVDHLQEAWAQPVFPFELDTGGFLEAQIKDLNGCFNVNNLAGANTEGETAKLKRLLESVGLEVNVADLIKDWVDFDRSVTGFGAEDPVYLAATPAYRAANQPMQHITEILLLDGVDEQTLGPALPYLCALPDTKHKININTAPVQVLAALDDKITLQLAQDIADSDLPILDLQALTDRYSELQPVASFLQINSQYFEMHASVRVGDSVLSIASLFFRNPETGAVILLQRDFAKVFQSNILITAEADQ